MQINQMKVKDFRELPLKKYGQDIGEFDSLVILPSYSTNLHDSGYRCIDFVAVLDNKALCRLSGCSDVLHINGIGGLGFDWLGLDNKLITEVKPIPWSIDCLPKSGLLRLFTYGKLVCDNCSASSFSIYAK